MGSICFLMLAPFLCGAQDVQDSAKELWYSGSFARAGRGGDGEIVKRFNLYCLLMHSEKNGSEIFFLTDERGGGGADWPNRYGVLRINQFNQRTNDARITLLFEQDGKTQEISLRQDPLFMNANRIRPGAAWEDDGLNYEFGAFETMAHRKCSRIEVANAFGRSFTVWVENGTSIVAALKQRVVVFAGEEFDLRMELDSDKAVDEKQLAKLKLPIETLLALRKSLKLSNNRTLADCTTEDFERADGIAARLEKEADKTPLSRLAGALRRDLKARVEHADDLKRLAAKFQNQQAPSLKLTLMDGTVKDDARIPGRVVVLHFWNYRHDPLIEPYGQVGYLDFLYNRRKAEGVDVFGVAVDQRLGDAQTAPTALRSIQQLKSFMNLSYPITLDDGTLLKQFGDPPSLGAELPLWVVIGPDGTVAEYKTGYYNIKPDDGLRELNEMVSRLLGGEKVRAKE